MSRTCAKNYRSKMRADCDMARQKLRDSAWFSGLEKAKVINPGRSLRDFCDKEGMDERLLWAEDPVHPTPNGYRAIAEDIVRVASSIHGPENRNKRLSDDSRRGRGYQGGRVPGANLLFHSRGQRGQRSHRGHRGHRGCDSKWPTKRSFYGGGKKPY